MTKKENNDIISDDKFKIFCSIILNNKIYYNYPFSSCGIMMNARVGLL